MRIDNKPKIESVMNHPETDYRIPDGEYQGIVGKHLLRLSAVKLGENEVTFKRQYTVGGMHYTVRSVFPISNSPTAEENLKRLMANHLEKDA